MTSFDPGRFLKKENIRVGEPLSLHTSFRIGGPCTAMLFPESSDELRNVISALRSAGEPYLLIGRGSNLLVPDEGYPGYVISLKKHFRKIEVHGETVSAEAGATLAELFRVTIDHGLGGLEFASGIPGTVGGALFMNAGAYGEEICGVVSEAELLNPDGEIVAVPASELALGYRTSRLQKTGEIALTVTMKLEKRDPDAIRQKADDLNERRKAKQPLEFPSAGSVFKRPEGYFAGKLIEDAGLKGTRVGNAEVSEKHAGFIVNKGNASYRDVVSLIETVQKRVFETSGVRLTPEIRIIKP